MNFDLLIHRTGPQDRQDMFGISVPFSKSGVLDPQGSVSYPRLYVPHENAYCSTKIFLKASTEFCS